MLLSQDAARGSQVLKVDRMACGLEVGMRLSVGDEEQPMREDAIISGFGPGSILLSAPLQDDHVAGKAVVVLAASPPMAPVAEDTSGVLDGDSNVVDDDADDQAWLVPFLICACLFLCFALIFCGCCWCRAHSSGKPRATVVDPLAQTYPGVTPREVGLTDVRVSVTIDCRRSRSTGFCGRFWEFQRCTRQSWRHARRLF